MLTIHADSRGHALAVRGERIEAAGPLAELSAGHPHARVRTWPGILTPGFVNLHGTELLERAYHPDPREAGLGTEPLTGDALRALALDDARWGASARRGVQRMLARGTVAAACEPFRIRAVQDAVRRTGLTVLPPETPPARTPGSAACFAVFDVHDETELAERGATATCVATVIAGRLLFRRR
ncbi:hypothetical protein L0F81_16755 [Streptomyces tricolor]|uniref:Aminodeoxyfutalosine deaminase/Imidazolonepropionase-like composite domain-containing protein n=1 Tax=Streptomyces tricolor TaxID=68277 RepID=A0ABS9JH89_9ACTN|nr:hypothetical protein [Streptomyces tricolor]MCG0064925.1 hypothetical protein [Streptomyces tricolor]